jgi:hypothetical protein
VTALPATDGTVLGVPDPPRWIGSSALIHGERARGGEPVWGADEGNVASLRLAQRFAFAPVDELWVAYID